MYLYFTYIIFDLVFFLFLKVFIDLILFIIHIFFKYFICFLN